jgi:hypothetical protein
MKIRLGFVSNSSTCSFQIYGVQLEREDINKLLKQNKELVEIFLEEYHKNTLKYKPNAEKYDTLEEFLDDNGYYEILDKILPEIKYLEKEEYYYGIDPSNMPDDETMGHFKKRIQDNVTELFGDTFKCSFIDKEFSC